MPARHRLKQDGINMVDLMMWLVIAALLLAAAIQGIGYYQKAAHLYTLKSNLDTAGTSAMRAATDSGSIDLATVEEGSADTPWNEGVTYVVEDPSGSIKPYIRASHPSVTDVDGIYLFEECGDDYKIGVNIIPKDGNPVLESCGVGSGTEGGGGGSTPPAPVFAMTFDCGPYTNGLTQEELDWTSGTTHPTGGWNTFVKDTATANTVTYYKSTTSALTGMHNEDGWAVSRVTGENATCIMAWAENGQYSRVGNPAYESFTGTFKTEEQWKVGGIYDRPESEGPAHSRWNAVTKNKTSESWYSSNKLHRDGGPASNAWTADGAPTNRSWYTNNVLHNDDGGPAKETWDTATGAQKLTEEWKINGTFHRIGGPANQIWNASGFKTLEEWRQDGSLHRLDGPASTTWTATGVIYRESWYDNGVHQRRITYDASGQPSYQEWYAANGTVERREDYPPATPVNSAIWQTVDTSSDGRKVLAGASTRSWRSDDGGTSWARMSSNAAWNNTGSEGSAWDSAVSSNGQIMFLGQRLTSGASNMYRSTDGGTTWGKVTALGTTGQWAYTDTSPDGSKVVTLNTAAAIGTIHISRDSGTTWTTAPLPSTGGWWGSVSMTDDGNTLYAHTTSTSSDRKVHVSRDGGATWAPTSLPAIQYWGHATVSPDGNTVLAFTTGGAGYRSTDAGATWSPFTVVSGFTNPSAPVFSENGTRLIISGGAAFSKSYYTSSDSGATWQLRGELDTATGWRVPNITPDGSKIIAFHPTTGYKTFPF